MVVNTSSNHKKCVSILFMIIGEETRKLHSSTPHARRVSMPLIWGKKKQVKSFRKSKSQDDTGWLRYNSDQEKVIVKIAL